MQTIFSETEISIIQLLGNRRISIKELSEEHFKDKKIPLNPNNVVSGAIVRINKKCKYYNLDWFIDGEGLGRGGKVVWKTKMGKESNKSSAKKASKKKGSK